MPSKPIIEDHYQEYETKFGVVVTVHKAKKKKAEEREMTTQGRQTEMVEQACIHCGELMPWVQDAEPPKPQDPTNG